jgi:hypothetical protein
MGNQLLTYFYGMDHDPVGNLDIGLLNWLLSAGEVVLASKPTSTAFPAVVLTVTDVSETLVTVPITCSSPPWAAAIVGKSARANAAKSAICTVFRTSRHRHGSSLPCHPTLKCNRLRPRTESVRAHLQEK